jgi:hypothetical protein
MSDKPFNIRLGPNNPPRNEPQLIVAELNMTTGLCVLISKVPSS